MTGISCPGSGRARISARLPRTAWNWQQGLAVAVIVGDVERSGPDRPLRSCDVKRRGEARVAIPERVAQIFVELPTAVLAVRPRGFHCARVAVSGRHQDYRPRTPGLVPAAAHAPPGGGALLSFARPLYH